MSESKEHKGNILLVDDLPDNLRLLSELLQKLNYEVRSVTSGKMALRTLKVKKCDVILLDIKMPEMDGYEVCQYIKNDPDLAHLPVIFISALDDAFDKVKAFEVGAVDYITKPFQVEEVVARLENQLTIQRQKYVLQKEINRRKRIEEILYQSRALLSSVLNTSLDGIAALQAVRNIDTGEIKDFRCLIVNPVIAKLFNRSGEDLVGKLIFRQFINRINPDIFSDFVDLVELNKPLSGDFYYPMGKYSWFHYLGVKLGDGFAITIRDIGDRKKAELILEEANQRLESLANSDSLTGVANRRCFDDFLGKEWQRHLQEKESLGLVLFDLDYFKAYNDFYGHQKGDECLALVAKTIADTVKSASNLFARYGGEEFALILANTDIDGCITITENIQKAIASLELIHEKSPLNNGKVTLSMGFSVLMPTVNIDSKLLISQADTALYQAKQQGRNRIVGYSSS